MLHSVLGASSLLYPPTNEFVPEDCQPVPLRTCPPHGAFPEWPFGARTLEYSHRERARVGSETRELVWGLQAGGPQGSEFWGHGESRESPHDGVGVLPGRGRTGRVQVCGLRNSCNLGVLFTRLYKSKIRHGRKYLLRTKQIIKKII